jgi:TonB family protein
MSTRSILIGAYELKRPYQRNMAIGFGVSGAVHVIAILIMVFWASLANKPVEAPKYVINTIAKIIPPPSLSHQQDQIKVAVPEHVTKPSIGVPIPVPDTEALGETTILNQDELAKLAPLIPVANLDDNIKVDVDKVVDELLPAPTDFVPYEEAPVWISYVHPQYPELAQRANIQGKVWVKALVDKEGKVRDAIISKESGANAGFEEAALEAARQMVWKPAISNGQPIAVWVTYSVEFKLR